MITDLKSWKAELLHAGRIVQDGDVSVEPEEAHRRFMRFVEIVDSLEGNEGPEVVDALFEAIQVEDSYGAYHSIDHALARFPESYYLLGLIKALPRLIAELPDQAGDQLASIANGVGGKWEYQIALFNQAVREAENSIQVAIVSFIRQQEIQRGWLDHRVWVLCPPLV